MNDEERKIIINEVSEFHRNKEDGYQQMPVSPINRWITYAILIPIVAVMALVGVFFFAAFLALLAVAAAVIGVRFWWLRRKFKSTLRDSDGINRQTETDQTIIIEDAQIIEETESNRAKQKKP